jgi:acyl-CoA thioesterase-1
MNTVGLPARGARLLLRSLALLLPLSIPVLAADVCPHSPAVQPFNLPHLRAALDSGAEGLVVALGSSSTQGAMASDTAHSYPAVLQETLSVALPGAHVAVVNRGIGGQDVAEELARLDVDVLALRPQLVVWQVGANGTLRHADPSVFHDKVVSGVRRMQAAGADVILMDNQLSPRLLAVSEEPAMDRALAQAAEDTGAVLFSRRALMEVWSREGAPFTEFIAGDGLHHNDHGYACVAQSLARVMLAGLTPEHKLTASR